MDAAGYGGPRPEHTCRVLAINTITPGIFSLALSNRPTFEPGQCVALAINTGGESRYYSIASAPTGDSFRILFDVVPSGYLTPKLAALAAGDTLFRSETFGSFLEPAEPGVVGMPSPRLWWIATGTGIAPFLSMGAAGKKLVHGARRPELLLFRDYFADRLGADYIQCTTKVHDAATYPGRLSRYLAETVLDGSHYMICGSAGMVVDVREILVGRGVPFSAISSEIYF